MKWFVHFIPWGQGLYEPWRVGRNLVGKYILLTRVLVILCLHGEEFPVLYHVTNCAPKQAWR